MLVAASLACWAAQAAATLGGALWLRQCPDECHSAVIGPLALTVLLAPAGIGLLVAGLSAWNRAGHEVPAPRAGRAVLLGAGTGVLVGVAVGALLAYRQAGAGNGYPPYEIVAFVNAAALGVTSLALGRVLR